VLFVSVLLKREQMSAQFRHEEYAERLEASMKGEGGQQLVRSKWVMLGQAKKRDENSVKECMDMKLEGKDKGRFEVADEFAEER
jgi:hypothetical protein